MDGQGDYCTGIRLDGTRVSQKHIRKVPYRHLEAHGMGRSSRPLGARRQKMQIKRLC